MSDQSTKIDLECGAISYNSELNTGYRWAIQKVRNIAARLPPEWRSLLIPQPCTESVEDRSKPTHRVGRGHRRQTQWAPTQTPCHTNVATPRPERQWRGIRRQLCSASQNNAIGGYQMSISYIRLLD